MSSLGNTGITLWDGSLVGGDPASIHGYSAALEASIRNRIVATFASTVARDAAFVGLTNAQKAGIVCYIQNREGHCYFDLTANTWQWWMTSRILFFNTRATAADITTSAPIILCPAIALPPGNRLIQIEASTVMLNLGTTRTQGRAWIGNLAAGDNYIQLPLDPGDEGSNYRSWKVVNSGTIDYDLQGLSTSASNAVRFTNSWLQIMDLGPTG